MIKASGRSGAGEPLLLLGLSGENVARLAADEPILIHGTDLQAMGLPSMDVVICYGRTEAEILTALRTNGLVKGKGDDTQSDSSR